MDNDLLNDPIGDPVATDESVQSESELTKANARADENYNKFLLAMADFENYKRRVQRDIEQRIVEHRRRLFGRLLPVLDNLERALAVPAGGEALRSGVESTLRGFEAVLTSEGISAVDVKGHPFDPHVAEAIGTVAATDGQADETVVEVAEKGYRLGDDLLRPAKVLVAKHQ